MSAVDCLVLFVAVVSLGVGYLLGRGHSLPANKEKPEPK